jgi:molecular chaperone GrpE
MNDTMTQQSSTTADVAHDVDVLHGPINPAGEREQASAEHSPARTVQIGEDEIKIADGDRIMNSATEIGGPGGANVTGGDLTSPQDAGETLDENMAQRGDEQDMFRRQMEGEVETQTKDLEPNKTDDGANDNGAIPQDTQNDSASGAGSSSANAASTRENEEDDHTRYLRALADLENYKRQAARRELETRERTTRRVIEDILPVLDNFERAVEASKTARDVDSVRIGIEFVAQQLRDALKSHGVEPIQTSGAQFDPLRHDALEEVAGTEHEEGAVIDEVQRGYMLNGQVLRTSRVRVAGK